MLATIGGYERRRAEAVLQSNSAAGELDHLGEQILAEQIRLGLTQLEKGSQQRQLEQAMERDEYMRLEKFTKLALRQQMAEQARELRYVWFQLVQERMLEVEACYRFELGEDPPPSDLAGPPLAAPDNDLLLGRRLLHDLRRIEAAYNQRRAEPRHALIKNVSLRKLAPAALLKLRATGSCSFSLTELDYDMDFPGQWDRRFKAIRASVHCVTGRYEGVNCILTKTVSKTRTTGDRAAAGPLPPDPPADCSIAISTGRVTRAGSSSTSTTIFCCPASIKERSATGRWTSPPPSPGTTATRSPTWCSRSCTPRRRPPAPAGPRLSGSFRKRSTRRQLAARPARQPPARPPW